MQTDYGRLRRNMVDNQLRTTDVTDAAVLAAMADVPRECFVPVSKAEIAYIDEDIAVAPGRYLLEPSALAKLLQLANIKSSDKVLDVGCATGYSSAVISRLAAEVVGVEQSPDLAARASAELKARGCENVRIVEGALELGHAAGRPYDVIVFEGAVDSVPRTLFDQLADNGRLVAVEGEGKSAAAWLHVREGATLSKRRGFNCAVPRLPGFEKAAEFVF
jgi:protein-L-isoaspartate(D-aspartate) O-methyltransferase